MPLAKPVLLAIVLVTALVCIPAVAQESIWIEAEWLNGITGYCWPGGKPEMRKTDGHWGLSGRAEWGSIERSFRSSHDSSRDSRRASCP